MDKDAPENKNQPASGSIEDMMGPPPKEAVPAPPRPAPSQPQAVPAKPAENISNAPKAGDTFAPTNPDKEEIEMLGGQLPTDKKSDSPKKGGKLRRFFRKWWGNPLTRKLTIFGGLAFLLALVVVPYSRYFILNSFGVRSSASVIVLDNSTQLPLKNVEVSIGSQTAKTDENGQAKVEHIKLGSNHLVIQKRAFATIDQKVVIGWGSNPLGNFQVQPTGSQYTFFLRDWLTGKIITEANASGGGADAQADDKGKLVLTIDTSVAQLDSLDVTFKSDNYRDEIFKLDLASKTDHTVRMVTNRRDVFISNRGGKYDVFTTYIDGKGEKLVLAGTGLERDDVVVVQHPTEDVAALVSSRVNARNNDGYILNTLTLINLNDNTTRAIAQSEQIQIVGWIGRRLVFVQIAAGASAADPQRFQLISYDYKTSDKKTLASANDFNDVLLDGDQIYYAPSGPSNKAPATGLIQSNADGSQSINLLKDEVWNIFRTNYDSLTIATAKSWYSYKIGSQAQPTKIAQSPTNPKNRLYINSQDNKHSLWIDQRDGKGLLIDYDTDKKTEKTLVAKGGLVYPVQWLTNDILIYRVHNDQETADYVYSLSTGKSHKITDVYNAPGINRWYYY